MPILAPLLPILKDAIIMISMNFSASFASSAGEVAGAHVSNYAMQKWLNRNEPDLHVEIQDIEDTEEITEE